MVEDVRRSDDRRGTTSIVGPDEHMGKVGESSGNRKSCPCSVLRVPAAGQGGQIAVIGQDGQGLLGLVEGVHGDDGLRPAVYCGPSCAGHAGVVVPG